MKFWQLRIRFMLWRSKIWSRLASRHWHRGEELAARDDHEGALAAAQRSLRISPRSFYASRLRIRCLLALRRIEELDRALIRHCADHPQDEPIKLVRIAIHYERGDLHVALVDLAAIKDVRLFERERAAAHRARDHLLARQRGDTSGTEWTLPADLLAILRPGED